jgi:hypothetical protein
MGSIGLPETSVRNYHHALRIIIRKIPDFSYFGEETCKSRKKGVAEQYSETNVMHFLFNFIEFYTFRTLIDHPQEVLHKRHLVCCVRVMSVGCTSIRFPLQVMLETCRGPQFLINWTKCITLVSLYLYTVMHS